MAKTFRVGVAGTGFGAAVHIPGFRRIPGVEVIALAGRDVERVRRIARELDIPNAVGSVDALLGLGLDAVSLALPPAENAAGAWKAILSRTPVLCEKPLSIDPVEARRLANASLGIVNGVDFQFVEIPAFQKLRNLVTSGRAGRLRRVHLTWLVESNAHRTGVWSWKIDGSAGGGVMTLLGTHGLHILEWLCGPLTRLEGRSLAIGDRHFVPQNAQLADDTADWIFDFECGASGTAAISNACPGGIGHRWELVFDQGIAVLKNPTTDYMHGFDLEFRSGRVVEVLHSDQTSADADGRLAPFLSLCSRFVTAVRSGGNMWPSFSDAARVAELGACITPKSIVSNDVDSPRRAWCAR
jgi:predicted dehydrogenase